MGYYFPKDFSEDMYLRHCSESSSNNSRLRRHSFIHVCNRKLKNREISSLLKKRLETYAHNEMNEMRILIDNFTLRKVRTGDQQV